MRKRWRSKHYKLAFINERLLFQNEMILFGREKQKFFSMASRVGI
jgi:hypothetical protein